MDVHLVQNADIHCKTRSYTTNQFCGHCGNHQPSFGDKSQLKDNGKGSGKGGSTSGGGQWSTYFTGSKTSLPQFAVAAEGMREMEAQLQQLIGSEDCYSLHPSAGHLSHGARAAGDTAIAEHTTSSACTHVPQRGLESGTSRAFPKSSRALCEGAPWPQLVTQ
eukprot:5910042-Amphidinium_carterae.1